MPGLWVAIGGGSLGEAVEASINRDEQFTTTASVSDLKPRTAELAVVSINGVSADYLGISQRGRRVATGQTTIAVSNLIPLDALNINDIRRRLPRRFTNRFDPPAAGISRFGPKLWQEVLGIIVARRPDAASTVRALTAALDSPRANLQRDGDLEIFERDAVASALQAWGGPSFRKRILRRAVPLETSTVAPFLSRLASVAVREDPQIAHDHTTFPGMEVARRDVVGSVVLHDHDEYLTIVNCNRQPLETTLGVDLIYYNHRFDSFVLVQYKRLTRGRADSPEYRPRRDPSHGKELHRMMQADRLLRRTPSSDDGATEAFRLSGRPFYVKLCEPRAPAALDAGMVSGMYIPLGLWRRLLKSAAVRGPRGGVAITWDNCPRRFANGEFTSLLRLGWIGSAAGRSKLLTEIVEDVLASGRMLVLAASSTGPPSRDHRRDTLGRFAADDDPAGAI